MIINRTAAIAALLLISTACGIGKAHNAGPTIERSYSVAAFHELTVAGPYVVNVTSAGKPGVTAHGSQEALDDLTVEVVAGDLRVMPKKKHGMRWGWHHDGMVVLTITGGSAIQEATVAGSGGTHLDSANGASFKGNVAGSGNLNITALTAQSAALSIAGSGDIRATGRTGKLSLDIAGSGDIDVPALQSADVDITIAGSGNIRGHASRTADVTIMGSGDVVLTGGAKCTVEKHGSGNVACS